MSSDIAPDIALKFATIVVTCLTFVISFAWGLWVWKENARKDREAKTAEAARLAETRRIEASRPFLELQLKLYVEIAQVAAKIAATGDEGAITRFWQLYYGELALVENRAVEQAMVTLGAALNDHEKTDLPDLALTLRQCMRDSLAKSWGTEVWRMEQSPASAS